MKWFLFLVVVWCLGLLITVIHEFAHVIILGGKLESLTIGISHKFAIRIKYKNLSIYPLLPFAGFAHITVDFQLSRFRFLCFTLGGCAFGLLIAFLCVVSGLWLLPAEALTEILATWRLGFLMRAIVHNTAGIEATIATAFIASGIMFGIQQIGNLLPFPGYDGQHALTILRNRRWHE